MTTQFVKDCALLARHMTGQAAPPAGFRQDAGEGFFFERQLESVEARFYFKKVRETKFRRLIPVSNRDGAGAQFITYYFYTKFGAAKIIANPTDDLPRVDVAATRHTAPVRTVGDSFGFSTDEIRSAQMAGGVPLEPQRADAARTAINFEFNRIAWNGDSLYGLGGVLDNPNVPDFQVAQAAGGTNSRVWGVDKTPIEIADDIGDRVIQMRQDTKEIHSPTMLLLPIDKKAFIDSTAMSSLVPTITISDWVKDKWDIEIEALFELTDSGTGASDQGLLYEMDSEVIELRIPMEMQTLPPQPRNLQFHIPAEARIGGVVIRYPLALIKFYGI